MISNLHASPRITCSAFSVVDAPEMEETSSQSDRSLIEVSVDACSLRLERRPIIGLSVEAADMNEAAPRAKPAGLMETALGRAVERSSALAARCSEQILMNYRYRAITDNGNEHGQHEEIG